MTPKSETKQFLTLTDVAKVLLLDVRSVRRMIKPVVIRGKKYAPALRATNISLGKKRGIWRVARTELDKFVASRNNK